MALYRGTAPTDLTVAADQPFRWELDITDLTAAAAGTALASKITRDTNEWPEDSWWILLVDETFFGADANARANNPRPLSDISIYLQGNEGEIRERFLSGDFQEIRLTSGGSRYTRRRAFAFNFYGHYGGDTGGHSQYGGSTDFLSAQVHPSPLTEFDGLVGEGATGAVIPAGGSTGQFVRKKSGADYDTEWANAPSGGGGTLADGAVTTAKLATAAVTSAKLAANAVRTTHIQDGEIKRADLANEAVNADKLAANAVTSAKLAANAVTTDKVQNGAITAAKLGSDVSVGGGAAQYIRIVDYTSSSTNDEAWAVGTIRSGGEAYCFKHTDGLIYFKPDAPRGTIAFLVEIREGSSVRGRIVIDPTGIAGTTSHEFVVVDDNGTARGIRLEQQIAIGTAHASVANQGGIKKISFSNSNANLAVTGYRGRLYAIQI
ncbi:MAG: hypothetical protein OXQ29_00755, partial [Rhodospirillaceae bacterium]|nr:hypothetical protein [Rhodospirillaceae bacterium]